MRDDAVYNLSPRWLEESGLPGWLNQNIDPAAWSVFKKLTEVEVEQNLLPDWFLVSAEDLADWTGLEEQRVMDIIQALVDHNYLNKRRVTARSGSLRLRFARNIEVPRCREEIIRRLEAHGWVTNRRYWRYEEPLRLRETEQKVFNLYEQLFGAKMNDRIAAELQEMARSVEYAYIEEVFQEAKKAGIGSLKWIAARLYREEKDERVSKDRRRPRRQKNPRRVASRRQGTG